MSSDNCTESIKYMSPELAAKEIERRALIEETKHKLLADIPTAKYGESPHAAIWRDRAEKLEAERDALQHRLTEAREALREINNCIFWSDTIGEWGLLGKIRTLPALTKVRAALAALEAQG